MNDSEGQPDYSARDDASARDVAEEMRLLGKNLISALRDAWDSEERRRLAQEIQAGLTDLSATLGEAAQEFTDSPTGQRLREDVQDFRQRVRSGEIEVQVREEILNALRMVNAELERARKPRSGRDEDSF